MFCHVVQGIELSILYVKHVFQLCYGPGQENFIRSMELVREGYFWREVDNDEGIGVKTLYTLKPNINNLVIFWYLNKKEQMIY